MLHDEAEDEEAVQDAWWKSYTHLQDFRAEARPTTWLTRIAVNEALMRLRRHKTRQARIQSIYNQYVPDTLSMDESTLPTPASSQPDHQAWNTELRGLIDRNIDAFTYNYRSFLLRLGVEDIPARERAALLDLQVATVLARSMPTP